MRRVHQDVPAPNAQRPPGQVLLCRLQNSAEDQDGEKEEMTCGSCGHVHVDTEPRVCCEIDCACMDVTLSADVMRDLALIGDRVASLLRERPAFREFPNKLFLFKYWEFYSQSVQDIEHLDDPESILRCRRRTCAEHPELSPKSERSQRMRAIKENVIREWSR